MPNTNFSKIPVTSIIFISCIFGSSAIAQEKQSNDLAQVPLDIERFCKNYPHNSACGKETEIDRENPSSGVSQEQKKVQTNNSWGIIPNASTLGLGGSIIRKINPQLNARIGVNAFSFELDYEEARGSYDSEVNLFNLATTLDYYPFKKSGFHTSIGAIYTKNNADGIASASSIFDVNIGGLNIGIDDLVDVNADVKTSRNFAPYLGIGWGNPINKNWGLWANLGVMFPGSPEVDLSANYKFNEDILPEDLRQDIQDGLDQEERAIEDDLDRFNVYPVITVGLTYSF